MVKIGILVAIIVFGVIVLIHEFGHFIVAKMNGIYVYEFAIGMGYPLFSIQGKETKYSLCLLPIGGYCDMHGEKEIVEGDDRAYCNKTVGQRMAVIAAGPGMNFLLSIGILLALAFGFGYTATTVDTVNPDMPAYEAGLESGDEIIGVEGHSVHVFDEISLYLNTRRDNGPIDLEILRDGEKMLLSIQPEFSEEYGMYMLGFSPLSAQKGFLGAIEYSFWKMIYYVKSVFISLGMLITGQVSMKQVAGPIGIFGIISDGYSQGIKYSILAAIANIAGITAFLSANLGVLNLLPIPALDGSHLIFLAIEGVRGRPVNPKIQNMMMRVGFSLLMLLMVVVLFNDVLRLVSG